MTSSGHLFNCDLLLLNRLYFIFFLFLNCKGGEQIGITSGKLERAITREACEWSNKTSTTHAFISELDLSEATASLCPWCPGTQGKCLLVNGQRDFRCEERADLVKLILFLQSLQRVIGRTEQSYWSWTNSQRLRDERPELSVSDGWKRRTRIRKSFCSGWLGFFVIFFWIEKGNQTGKNCILNVKVAKPNQTTPLHPGRHLVLKLFYKSLEDISLHHSASKIKFHG